MHAAAPLVCLGEIVGPHGVRGAVRVRSFAETPEGLVAYGPLSDSSGQRRFDLTLIGESRGGFIARIEGVEDRDAAERLRGTQLYVRRDLLPEPEPDDYYHVDLIGLSVVDRSGKTVGRVRAVLDLPGGDVLEIEREGGGELLLPFTRANVPTVDLDAGRMVIDPPREAEPQ